jgi:uncharacterized protein
MSPERPAFQQQQFAFAAHIRDPQRQPVPDGIEARRMAVYSEIIFNALNEQLSTVFPVLNAILGESRWQALLRDFMIRHRAQTPLFTELGLEFVEFLQDERAPQPDDHPFMAELAHYEYVELAVAISDADTAIPAFDPNGDLMHAHPLPAPTAWSLSYRYPVHLIGPDNLPAEAPAQATYLVVYRDRQDQVHFLEINVVTARLLALLQENPHATGLQLMNQIANELQHPDPDSVVQAGSDLLQDLRRRNIVLGSTPV